MLYSTTLPFLLFSSILLTSSLLACSSLSSAKKSGKANTRKVARASTCRQAGVICRRLRSNRNHRRPLASTQRSNVCACAQVLITAWSAVKNELHTVSHASDPRCFAIVFVFVKDLNGKVNEKDTRTWMSFVFENYRVFLFTSFISFYRIRCTVQFSFAYFARQELFPMFSFEILRVKIARGLPELIPSGTPDVWPLCCLLPAFPTPTISRISTY